MPTNRRNVCSSGYTGSGRPALRMSRLTPKRHRDDEGKEPLAIYHQRKTIADCKRVAEQTGILTKEPDHPPQEC